ncbi:hypothetical protein [Paenibacillus sp. PSB04]|uniref:hypothetical protein n=1 Tax=Paenibacillus sp. PSB04 TaxID=2866810 RepID=UPI0021F19558|nr:hypothetical protein [Paenibacillus sp. PSB04]UYO04900.1 hypothetical protein K2F33_02520 [Paenibacillus sp. PSB04]
MRDIKPLGRKFFWVKSTGNIIAQRDERIEGIESTKEEDFEIYIELQGLDRDAIEMTVFEPGQYAEDFAQAKNWRFDPETGKIVFSYPDLNDPTPQEPLSQPPLTAQISELRERTAGCYISSHPCADGCYGYGVMKGGEDYTRFHA